MFVRDYRFSGGGKLWGTCVCVCGQGGGEGERSKMLVRGDISKFWPMGKIPPVTPSQGKPCYQVVHIASEFIWNISEVCLVEHLLFLCK